MFEAKVKMRILSLAIMFFLAFSLDEARGQRSIKLVKTRKSRKPFQNKHHFGGDMVGEGPQPKGVLRSESPSATKAWPRGIIYFEVQNDAFSVFDLETIEQAMRRIESKTCIRFKKRDNEEDYIYIMKGNGCYSYVGRRGGSQDVSLGPGCIYVGTVVHELMHAIGFYHEHMRSDRDSYLTIHFKNIEIGMKDQFTKVSPKYNHLYTRFDYDSIMIYSSTAFSKNGRHTMDPKQRGNKLVNPYDKNGLSSLDIINVKKMYNNEC